MPSEACTLPDAFITEFIPGKRDHLNPWNADKRAVFGMIDSNGDEVITVPELQSDPDIIDVLDPDYAGRITLARFLQEPRSPAPEKVVSVNSFGSQAWQFYAENCAP
jgi:hypothetical protein